MKLIKVEGLVIKDMDFKESSKILTILTKEYGLISVISKGCKQLKSKLRGVSNKLVYGNFDISYKENGLSTLISVDVINPFTNILMDIDKISYVSYLIELTNQIIKETNNFDTFDLLKEAIIKINDEIDLEIIKNIIELKYLRILGVGPIIEGCVICGNNSNIKTISIDNGGYICENCHKNEFIYSDKLLKLIRMFILVDISKITKLNISDDAKKELDLFIDSYYDKYTGLYLNSKQFLKNLKKLG